MLWLVLASVVAAASDDGRLRLGADHLEVAYWPEHTELGFEVLDASEQALKSLAGVLDLDLQDVLIRVDIVRSNAELNDRAGTPPNAPARDRLPPWTLGVSLHHANHVILMPVTDDRLRRLVVHELTHVALDLKLRAGRREAPRWVHEGLAQWMEGEMPAVQKDVLGRAAAANELLPRAELQAAFDGPRQRTDLAYAQSHALVQYIVEKGPPGALGRFMQFLVETGDEDLALRRAMRLPLDVVDRKWLTYLRSNYLARGVPLTVELIIIGLMVLAFAAAVVVRFRAATAIRRRMREEEQLRALFMGVEPPDETLEDTNDEWRLRE